jgi:oligopeptide/dipeptide ABC transporter ATP-binding protein
MGNPAEVLQLADVSVRYRSSRGDVSAVSEVSLNVPEGEIVALVGESGCGKSTLAMAIMGLLPGSASVSGSIRFRGTELVTLAPSAYRRLRGDRISMVFQDPLASLDPSAAVGEQIAETIRAHRRLPKRDARERAVQLMSEVGIPAASQRYGDAPFRFSGGMRQRIVIAAALANEPALLLLDEPTTALDVTIQAQILALVRRLRDRHGMTVLLIAHDLGVVAQLADRIGVMYAGQLVEVASASTLFAAPHHPYTQALLEALPTPLHAPGSLRVIAGQVPDLADPPPGCRFAGRCPYAMPVCATVPPLARESDDHEVACWLSDATRMAAARATDLRAEVPA